jgi:glucokinase-like ROK family protein
MANGFRLETERSIREVIVSDDSRFLKLVKEALNTSSPGECRGRGKPKRRGAVPHKAYYTYVLSLKKVQPGYFTHAGYNTRMTPLPMDLPDLLSRLEGGLIVSCQALPDEPLHGAHIMAAMARAAAAGGGVGIRANGPEDIAAIRQSVELPIIGLWKDDLPGFSVRITPTVEHARRLAAAGADIIAIDATARPHPDGLPLPERIAAIHRDTNRPVLADIATLEEGLAAQQAGADLVAPTLSGYTEYSPACEEPDFGLIQQLAEQLSVPVIAEGRIVTPEQAARALALGAFAVVVGGAISRPQQITARFVTGLKKHPTPLIPPAPQMGEGARGWGRTDVIGAVDIGGTKIAVGVVDEDGRVRARGDCPTDAQRGLADGLRRITEMLSQTTAQAGGTLRGIGIGCTGPVHPRLGTIGNVEFLPGWEGASLAGALSQALGVSAAIENDADAAALGEWAWGTGRGADPFLLVTVGTGIGVGVIINGKLYRGVDGAHPELGHHVIDPSGPGCFCGARGCWESMACGPAMERWAQENHPQGRQLSARELCSLADQGDAHAQESVQRTARYLGLGIANLVTLFAPQMIALGGGLLQSHHLFLPAIREAVRTNCGLVPHERVKILPASLGADTGLAGAAQVWLNRA